MSIASLIWSYTHHMSHVLVASRLFAVQPNWLVRSANFSMGGDSHLNVTKYSTFIEFRISFGSLAPRTIARAFCKLYASNYVIHGKAITKFSLCVMSGASPSWRGQCGARLSEGRVELFRTVVSLTCALTWIIVTWNSDEDLDVDVDARLRT